MHELGLVEGLREIALEHTRSAGAARVVSIRVAIAESSSYLEDAMAMFWGEVCCGTEVAGARIEFVRIPGEWLCLSCLKSFAGDRQDCRCVHCGSDYVKPASGEECYVESMELETC